MNFNNVVLKTAQLSLTCVLFCSFAAVSNVFADTSSPSIDDLLKSPSDSNLVSYKEASGFDSVRRNSAFTATPAMVVKDDFAVLAGPGLITYGSELDPPTACFATLHYVKKQGKWYLFSQVLTPPIQSFH